MKTISKIELALAAGIAPFVGVSEPDDADLRLIESMFSNGYSVEEIVSSLDDIEALRHVRIPAIGVYAGVDITAHECKVVELYPESVGNIVSLPTRC